jgi:hypothetical protein
MERKTSRNSEEGDASPRVRRVRARDVSGGVLAWWYHRFAPPQPPANASFIQRERVRRGRIASIVMPIFMLFLLGMLLLAVIQQDTRQALVIGVGIAVSGLIFWLNRQGWIKVAGLLVLTMVYAGEIFSLLLEPGGLAASNIFMLDFTVIPYVMVLSFFSANSLFPVVVINALLTWGLITFGPHDATISSIVARKPLWSFTHVYLLQLMLASTLYLWARSTETALQRADQAEEIAALEKRENERKQGELEQKAQLDSGIQQILQTLIAAANGDLSARAPLLNQDHVLWQVAMSLNNLIARLQSSSHTESELRQQIWEGSERVETGRVTGAQRALPKETGRVTGAQRALPKETGKTISVPGTQRTKPGLTSQQPVIKQSADGRAETGATVGRLKALRLEQEGATEQEKATRPEPGHITEAHAATRPVLDNEKEH